MLEDDKDKVRRNLVALSGFIIASSYLGLKLPETVFHVQLPRETNKIWTVVLVALVYAFWRFFHSEEARKARSSIAAQYADCRDQVFNILISQDLKRVFRVKSPRWIDASPIEARLEHERKHPQYKYVRLSALVPVNTQRWPYNGFEKRSGSTVVKIIFSYRESEVAERNMDPTLCNLEHQGSTTIGELPFVFPRWVEFFATGFSIAILLVRSETIPEVLFPCGMATVAAVIAIARALS